MPELDDSDKQDVCEIVQKHVASNLLNVTKHETSVSVQFHDNPDSFGELLADLHDHSFSYSVNSAWEAPPKIRVDSRDYYEEL